jgi:hypothetical protein
MHFWNIDALATELRSGKLTEEQAFKYFLVLLVAQAVPLVMPWRSEGALNFYTMGFGPVIPIVWLVTGVAGLIVCFKANQKADGVDFIRRFVCLEIPSFIRTITFCLPLLLFVTLLVRPFVPKGSSHSVALVLGGLFVEFMAIVQYTMIYRRLRGPVDSASGPERAA